MKNIAIILFLFCCSSAYSYNHPIHMNLNKKYFESWANYHLSNILYKFTSIIINNKAPVFEDSNLNIRMSKISIRNKVHSRKLVVKAGKYGGNNPTKDSIVYIPYLPIICFDKVEYYFKKDSIDFIGFYKEDFQSNRVPLLYLKCKDLGFILDSEEKFVLDLICSFKKSDGLLNRFIIQKSDISDFAIAMHKNIENKLFSAIKNIDVPIYANDSLFSILEKKTIEEFLEFEVVSFPFDPLDTFGMTYDSIVYTNYARLADTGGLSAITLIWIIQKDGGLSLAAAAPLYSLKRSYYKIKEKLYAIGFIKSNDFKVIYNKDEEKILNFVSYHALYVNSNNNETDADKFKKWEDHPWIGFEW